MDLRLHVGQDFGGEVIPRIDQWIVRFDYRNTQGSGVVPGQLGDDPAGHLKNIRTSTSVIYQGQRKVADLSPEKFDSYLEEEGLEQILEERSRRGERNLAVREWYSRYAKAIIQPRGAGGDAWGFRFGMPLELVPLSNPATPGGAALPVRLVYQGQPLQNTWVVAYNRKHPEKKLRVRTDAAGVAELPLVDRGVWLIKAVHMIRAAEDDPEHQWESFWASLTFER